MPDVLKLLSPTVVNFPETTIQTKMSHDMYTENRLGVKRPVTHSVLVVSEMGKDNKYDLPLDPQILFGKELVAELSNIKSLIGDCSQIAERLFGQLKSLNQKLKGVPDLQEFFEPYKEKYEKLDFMGHRQILGAIIKSKKNECVNKGLGNYDPKSVRVALENFILDRNKYTHGEVVFWQNEHLTLLEYNNNVSNKLEHAIVNAEILNSFSNSYTVLSKIFSTISACLD